MTDAVKELISRGDWLGVAEGITRDHCALKGYPSLVLPQTHASPAEQSGGAPVDVPPLQFGTLEQSVIRAEQRAGIEREVNHE